MPTIAARSCWSISASAIARTCVRPTCRRSDWQWTGWDPAGDAVQPIFITLDPARDTPEHLKEYVAMFHTRFVGLTGDAAALDAAARAYRVYYARVELEKSDYTVDHSAFIYLMGRHGEYLGFFPPGTSAEILAGTLKPLVAGR